MNFYPSSCDYTPAKMGGIGGRREIHVLGVYCILNLVVIARFNLQKPLSNCKAISPHSTTPIPQKFSWGQMGSSLPLKL